MPPRSQNTDEKPEAEETIATEVTESTLPRERDPHDVGAGHVPGDPVKGPEDALDPTARGDYSSRLDSGPHYVPEIIPEAERVPGGPITRMVPAGTQDPKLAPSTARAD